MLKYTFRIGNDLRCLLNSVALKKIILITFKYGVTNNRLLIIERTHRVTFKEHLDPNLPIKSLS